MEPIQSMPNPPRAHPWKVGLTGIVQAIFPPFSNRFRHYTLLLTRALVLISFPVGAHETIIADGKVCSLANAITAANTDTAVGGCLAGHGTDTIVLGYSVKLTATDNDTDGPNGLPSVTSTLTIKGNNRIIARIHGSNASEIPCYEEPGDSSGFRIFHVSATGKLTLDSVKIKGGTTVDGGGGIFNAGTLVLIRSTLSCNNISNNGGGIFSTGTLIIVRSTISKNQAAVSSGGGGIYSVGKLILDHSTVSRNDTFGGDPSYDGRGGGIYNGGSATIAYSTITRNIAAGGGGLHNTGSLKLANSTVSHNHVSSRYGTGSGGGIFNDGSAALIRSTVSNNIGSNGGGLLNDGTFTLINSTVSGNITMTDGYEPPISSGNIENWGSLSLVMTTVSNNHDSVALYNQGGVTLINSLIANNEGGDCSSGPVTAVGVNLIGDGNCGSSFPAGTDAKLGPLIDNGGPTRTQSLLPDSPAIDQIVFIPGVGCDSTTVTKDQRGVRRPQPPGGKCDIGAFELARRLR